MEYFYKWHSILSPLKIGMLEWVTYGGDERMLMYTLSLNDTYVILNIYSIQQRQVLFYVAIFFRSLVYTVSMSFSMWFWLNKMDNISYQTCLRNQCLILSYQLYVASLAASKKHQHQKV